MKWHQVAAEQGNSAFSVGEATKCMYPATLLAALLPASAMHAKLNSRGKVSCKSEPLAVWAKAVARKD